ncbi:hypothetical protein [Luteolibacter luteus]|uniref:Uncharacterized protein n=1 Tax=Luteolibacter luteus TaxID=2728835 RepID=A0A858RGI7_9BACT|nr:hypothetical protein [Luteolibacter luteus]QJE95957.1 hypothetical protein HHL09_09240 [Luteolibacter luteus]
MLRLRTIAHAMKSRLEEIPELQGKVVVFFRANVGTEFEKRMTKTRGRAVIIRLLTGQNTGGKAKTSFYVGNYAVDLFTVPLLTQKDIKDADDLMTEIEEKLQGWWPPEVPSNRSMYITCGSVTFEAATGRDGAVYDVATLTAQAPGNLIS